MVSATESGRADLPRAHLPSPYDGSIQGGIRSFFEAQYRNMGRTRYRIDSIHDMAQHAYLAEQDLLDHFETGRVLSWPRFSEVLGDSF